MRGADVAVDDRNDYSTAECPDEEGRCISNGSSSAECRAWERTMLRQGCAHDTAPQSSHCGISQTDRPRMDFQVLSVTTMAMKGEGRATRTLLNRLTFIFTND